MTPERYYRNEILLNNYGENMPSRLSNRADYCVRVLSSKLIEEKLTKKQFQSSDRLIYLYKDNIRVKEHDVFDKPTCNREAETAQSRKTAILCPV